MEAEAVVFVGCASSRKQQLPQSCLLIYLKLHTYNLFYKPVARPGKDEEAAPHEYATCLLVIRFFSL